jgi:hypothetical protein
MGASGEGCTNIGTIDATFLERVLPVYMNLCMRYVVLAEVTEECMSATGRRR